MKKKSESILTEAQAKAVKQYSKLIPEYKKLGHEVKNLIKSILNKANIKFIEIAGRVKKINSFREKIIRKNYKNPLLDTKDLCAIRIICSFPEDLKIIQKTLEEKFKILVYKNLENNINPYKFWYRSHHFKILLNDNQITREKYKLLKYFIVEIQVRTVFMDAWAKMEHEINYKHEWNTSNATKRKLSRLSAILELADEQIQELINNTEGIKTYNKYYQKFKRQRIINRSV